MTAINAATRRRWLAAVAELTRPRTMHLLDRVEGLLAYQRWRDAQTPDTFA